MRSELNKSSFKHAAFVAALLAGVAMPCASAKVFSFGDSYSDNGNVDVVTGGVQPGPDYWEGRFTNGWTVAERLAFRLSGASAGRAPGLNSIQYPSGTSAAGGVNFAHGGATAVTRATLPKHLSAINQTKYYRDSWTARRISVSVADVATIWSGANDYLVYNATNTSTVASSIVNTMVANVASTGLGAILVFNLHNLGDLPGYIDSTRRTSLNNLTSTHNINLSARLAAAQPRYTSKLILVDVNRAISLAHQGLAGGFTVTRPGQNGSASGNCLGDGKPMLQCPSNYLYYDFVHFSQSGHEYLASIAHDRLNSVMAQARQARMAATGTAAAMALQSRSLGARFAALRDDAQEGLGAFSFGGLGQETAALSQDGERSFGGGADLRWGEWVAGAAAIRVTPDMDTGEDASGFSLKQTSDGVSAYMGWIAPDASLTVSATHMRGEQETKRSTLVQGLPVAFGQTAYAASAVEMSGSAMHSWGAWSLTGEAALRYDDARVAAFQEWGTLGLSDTAYDALEERGVNGRAGVSLSFKDEDLSVSLGAYAVSRLSGNAQLSAALPVMLPGLSASRYDETSHPPLSLQDRAAAATFAADWRIDEGARLTVQGAAIATPEGEMAAGLAIGANLEF